MEAIAANATTQFFRLFQTCQKSGMHYFPFFRKKIKRNELPGSMSVEQQLEKLSRTGYRLSHYCEMSISDSKEDIYLCENATDFYLRFGALLWNRSGGNDSTHKQLCWNIYSSLPTFFTLTSLVCGIESKKISAGFGQKGPSDSGFSPQSPQPPC